MRTALKLGMTVSEYYECTDRDLYNFVRARYELINEDREQMWDYSRHIMWASLAGMTGKPDSPTKVIRLKRDGKEVELTPYLKQEISEWSKKMDAEILG